MHIYDDSHLKAQLLISIEEKKSMNLLIICLIFLKVCVHVYCIVVAQY